jgi:hypothetical protein
MVGYRGLSFKIGDLSRMCDILTSKLDQTILSTPWPFIHLDHTTKRVFADLHEYCFN